MRNIVFALAAPTCMVLLLLGSVRAWAIPEVQAWRHDSGATVYFVPAPELAIVDISISFAAGSARDGEHHGLASLTALLLDEGAGGHDADAIAEAFAQHASSFSATVDLDRMTVDLRCLSEELHLQAVVEQLALVLQQPDFPPQAIERERARVLASLQARQQSPGDLAQEKLYAAIYGSHPYAFPTSGSAQTVKLIKRGHLQRFHQRYLTAANASVAIVGDLDQGKARQIVRQLLDGLPEGDKASPLEDVSTVEGSAAIETHSFPSSQTHILLGHASVSIDDPNRIALYLGNHILGSGMVSRLFLSIREQHGLAYSVYSYFLPLQSAGPFVAGMQTEASQAKMSVRLLRQQLREYIDHGPSKQELQDAKSYIKGNFANRISSNAKLARYISWMAFYDLPADYLQRFISMVEEVGADQVRQSFKAHLRIDELQEVQFGGGA